MSTDPTKPQGSNPYQAPQQASPALPSLRPLAIDQPFATGSAQEPESGQRNSVRDWRLDARANGFQWFQLQSEVQKLQNQGMVVDQAKLQEAELTIGGFAATGVLFIVFGLLVKSYPVPITISALVIYVGCAAIVALYHPRNWLWARLSK